MTGAGFGGCVVVLVSADGADRAATEIVRRYDERTGRAGTALLCRASEGTRVEPTAH
jgi:galactokinase